MLHHARCKRAYLREWRNWQTRMIQVHVFVRTCRFKSCFPHHQGTRILIQCPGSFFLHKITTQTETSVKKALYWEHLTASTNKDTPILFLLCAISFFYRWFVWRLQARFKAFAPAVLSKPNRRTYFRENRHKICYTLRPNVTEYAHFSLVSP